MKRLDVALIGLSVAAVACSDSQNNAPTQLNLDRPVDIAFSCYGGLRLTDGLAADPSQPVIITAQPVESCNIRSGPRLTLTDPDAPPPPGQEKLDGSLVPPVNWFGFILQSGPGTVGLARFETKPSASFGGGDVIMLDTDPLTPGKNGISVGENPIAIATDRVGCYEVIANQGSCDMSILDINSVFGTATDGRTVTDAVVNRMDVRNAAGQVIRARPVAMAFEPPSGVIGAACPLQATGLAYIAYPSCHLVAGVDVATGTIVTGVQFDASGMATVVDGNVSCPAECDGAPSTPGVRPTAIDLEVDPTTGRAVLAIGADNSNVLTVYDLDPQLFKPLGPVATSITLENTNGRLGLTSVAITPVIGMGGFGGTIDDTFNQHQFVYAVATDGSVRVADITGAPHECDAQVDPRYIYNESDPEKLACIPVGAPTTPPRRANARGPGIELVGDGVPTSVDVFRVDPITNDSRGITPARLIGYFGVITASNGQTFVFNVDDDNFADVVDLNDPLSTPVPLVAPHQLRDAIPDRGRSIEKVTQPSCDDSGPDPDAAEKAGGPRAVGAPTRTLPSGVFAQEKVGGLPLVQQVMCTVGETPKPVSELFFSAPDAARDSLFPDLRGLRGDENWTLTWEGSLSLDKSDTAIDGPAIRFGQIHVDGFGMHLVDDGHPYCEAGVEPNDIVQLRGCDPTLGDDGCPPGYTCYVHPQSQVTGIGACILSSEAERLQNSCKAFLTSLRRYTVGRTQSGELQLVARKFVLRTTPIDGCTDDAQCQALANYAVQNGSPTNPIDDRTPPDTHTYSCMVDPDRAPIGGTGKRCVMTCATDANCGFGTICQGGICMEGVVPPQSCVNAPQRYELRAGQAFTVVGSRQGYMHPIVADAAGMCVKNPMANPYLVGRIPLTAPPCDPLADPRTGRLMNGTYEPNPCQLTVPEAENQLNYTPGTCSLATPNTVIATRDATALQLRNRAMKLTIVDPTYPGDGRCNGDRGGSFVNVPLVTPGFQIAFRQTAGFSPLAIDVHPSFPVKVVRGPTQSIWVIDEGDFLSTSPTLSSTRGKVYRIESRALSIINTLD